MYGRVTSVGELIDFPLNRENKKPTITTFERQQKLLEAATWLIIAEEALEIRKDLLKEIGMLE